MRLFIPLLAVAIAAMYPFTVAFSCRCDHFKEKPCCAKEQKKFDCCCPHFDNSPQQPNLPDTSIDTVTVHVFITSVNVPAAAPVATEAEDHDCGPPLIIRIQKLNI